MCFRNCCYGVIYPFFLALVFDAFAHFHAMTCLCRGCAAKGCTATEQRACGEWAGREKDRKAAGRCHWCLLSSAPSSSSFTASAPSSSSFTASAPPSVVPLDLFLPKAGEYFPLIGTPHGTVPRTRHASGPCWETQLGPIKNLVSDLHQRSMAHGWKLTYWSHEAMDATMKGVPEYRLQSCYFAIDPEYRAARTDLFRFWLMWRRGGVWLDLRGNVSDDPSGFGLESLVRPFDLENDALVPDFLLIYGGQHKEKFNNAYGEIINGFLMSVPGMAIWERVIWHICSMIESYPERWKANAVGTQSREVVDRSRSLYSADCDMTGREGVLCLGPLAMTAIVMPHLREHRIDKIHLSKTAGQCIGFESYRKFFNKKDWSKSQAELFWKDPRLAERHVHYSKLVSPIVDLEFAATPTPVFHPPPPQAPMPTPSTIELAAAPAPIFSPPPPEAPRPTPNTPERATAGANPLASQSTAQAAEASGARSSGQRQRPVVDSFSRSRSRRARCNSCRTADGKLTECKECTEHGCRQCGFWCTLCTRRGHRYFICGRCHNRAAFLTEIVRGKVWACRRCRP